MTKGQTGFSVPLEEPYQIVARIVQDVLPPGEHGLAYSEQILQVLARRLRQNVEEPSVDTLPILTCQASGGSSQQALPVAVAWQVILLTFKLLDDVEDNEIDDQTGVVINMTTGLLSIAQLLLTGLSAQEVPYTRVQLLHDELYRAVLRACAGQHADLTANQIGAEDIDPDTWLEIARAKSGEFFAWAAWAGALVAGAPESFLASLREYGAHLGVLIQMADDFKDVWYASGISDLVAGRPALPVSYALLVTEGSEREHLRALLKRVAQGDDEAETQVRQLLADLGAQHYLLTVARVQYQQALAALQRASPASLPRQQLVGLLDRILPDLITSES